MAQNKYTTFLKISLALFIKCEYLLRVMNNTMNSNPTQLASQIAEIILNKGTAFAGFDYNGHRRNVTLGANLAKAGFVSGNGSGNWGKTFAHGSLVEHNGKLYMQGIENNLADGSHIKRFDLAKAENFVIG